MQSKSQYIITADQAMEGEFDFVIVGGGLGGATAAYGLVNKGYNVLLVEQGTADLTNENRVEVNADITDPAKRVKYHLWPTRIAAKVDSTETLLYTPTGTGLGGSSRLYAGALERLEPIDFETQSMPNGDTIEWPYTYQEIAPYYQQAEILFNVHGSSDPLSNNSVAHLSSPNNLNQLDSHFFNLFESSELHPYHLHVAVSKHSNDDRIEIMSALEACILPALETGKLWVLEQTEVTQLHGDKHAINEITIESKGLSHRLSVKRLILAAGALFTPLILQRSISKSWPNGIGNNNDLVGRNLMFHVSDYIGIWGHNKYPNQSAGKTIGIRDFYIYEGQKLGQLQSMGIDIEFGYILYFLRNKFDQSWMGKLPVLNKLMRQLLRIPALVAVHLFKDACVYSSVIEDYPYHDNCVIYDSDKPSNICIHYKVRQELKNRVKTFRRLVKSKIKSKLIIILNGELLLNYGHPCGTCRAGHDPSDSVIDSHGKLHGMSNLYICDASFMPTSGGTNPSLTIVANALRLVDNINIKEHN